jgi:hypothetical protein
VQSSFLASCSSSLSSIHLSEYSLLSVKDLVENYIIVVYNLKVNNNIIEIFALIEYGATTMSFIEKQFVFKYNLPLTLLQNTHILEQIEGYPV